jgi:uncharacterized protein (TIGR02117 family)
MLDSKMLEPKMDGSNGGVMKSASPPDRASNVRSPLRVAGRMIWRSTCCLALGYGLCVIVGLIPVNNGHQPATSGINVYFISNAIHSDIVIPLDVGSSSWRSRFPAEHFRASIAHATHVAIGWGDRGFYLGTPSWADLRVSTAAKALFLPSSTCMHVTLTSPRFLHKSAQCMTLSEAEFERLQRFIETSFARSPSGERIRIPDAAYGLHDAFYAANGSYHAFNTCNCWVGRALRVAGVRVGWFTPLPKTPLWYCSTQ